MPTRLHHTKSNLKYFFQYLTYLVRLLLWHLRHRGSAPIKYNSYQAYRFYNRYKKSKKLLFLAALFLLPSLAILAFTISKQAKPAQADWFDDGWAYRKKIPVTNSGTNLTDYQLQLSLDVSTLITDGKIQSDCDDLRFTSATGQELSYWLEPGTCGASTKVWVKLPTVHTTGTDIYWYYGNPSASSRSSTTNTFIRDMPSAAAAWPLDDTTTDQSYARVLNPALSTGRDIVINGGFDASSNWSFTVGSIAISGGSANFTSTAQFGTAYQTSSLVSGKSYQITYTISNYTSGSVAALCGNAAKGTDHSANGTYTDTITCAGTLYIGIQAQQAGTTLSIDNVSAKQVNLPSSGSFTGSELLTDGNMEAAGTSNWSTIINGTFTKDTSAPHGGTQNLRIARNGTDNNPAVGQTILVVGKTYRATGYVKSDGNALARIRTIGSVYFTSTTSTSWQPFDVTFVATYTTFEFDALTSTGTQYAEFDDISVTEVDPLVAKIPTSASGNRPTIGTDSTGGHLSKAFTFDGTDDAVNTYSSDLNSVFDPSEGTLVVWTKVTDSGVWTDSTNRWLARLYANGSNEINIQKLTTNNRMVFNYVSGGTTKAVTHTNISSTNWLMFVLTWNKSTDEFKVYINGSQFNTTQTGLGTWSGNLSSTGTIIGSSNTTGSSPWSGDINDVRLYSRALTADEISQLYSSSENRQAYYTENYPGHELIRQYNTNVSTGTLASEEQAPGPAAYWKFDEGADNTCSGGTNDICDSTTNHNDGAINGNPTWQTEDKCISGKCMYFDGVGDFIDYGDVLDLHDSFTVSAWAKPVDLSAPHFILSKGDENDQYHYELRYWSNTGNFDFIVYQQGTAATPYCSVNYHVDDTNLYLNKWSHFAGVVNNGTGCYLYINGQLVASDDTLSGSTRSDGTDPLRIGTRGADEWKGFLDEVKIYPFARTATEIKSDYERGAAAAGSSAVLGAQDTDALNKGLVGYWKMDETSGTTVADASGNGNTGTLTNAQESGTSNASGNTTVTLADTDGSLSATDDAYNGMILNFTATCGSIASGTQRVITDYSGSTSPQVITVGTALDAAPDSCAYSILHQVGGKFGSSTAYDGTNDFVTTTDLSSIENQSQITYAAWINTAIDTNSQPLISKFTSASSDTTLYYRSGGNLFFRVANGSNTYQVSNGGTMSLGTWYHIAAVYNGSLPQTQKIKLYINGVEQTSTTISGTLPSTTIDNAASVTLGGSSVGNYYQGKLDEVRVYSRALSSSEIQRLYNWAPGPVGYWKMDAGSGTTITDSSGNGNTGTFSSSPANPTWTTGKIGEGLSFDGNDVITVSNNSSLNMIGSVTMEAWVKTTDTSGTYHAIFENGGFSGVAYRYSIFYNNSGQVYVTVNDGAPTVQNITSTKTINDGAWHHIAGVIDKNSTLAKIFIDGNQDTSTTLTRTGTYINGYSSHIGGYNPFFTTSQIDDVRVYNYARTPTQILQDMNAASGTVLGSTSGGKPIPIAWYKFDEQQGQTTHATNPNQSSTLDGTLGASSSVSTDDPTWKTASSGSCKNQGCLSFDGGDYVGMSDNSATSITGSFTLSAWVNPSSVSGTKPIIAKDASSNTSYYLSLESGKIRMLASSDGTTLAYKTGSTTLSTGTWYHVLGVYNASSATISLYLNGQSDGGTTTGTMPSSIYDNNANVNFGYDQRLSYYFSGYIDDPKIYNFALTADQVKEDYTAGSAITMGSVQGVTEASTLSDGAGNPPIAYWKLDDNTGTSAVDSSGNNSTGSITSTTWTAGKVGPALSFDGSTSSVTAGDPASGILDLDTSDFTLEAWIKTPPGTGAMRIINKRASNIGYEMYFEASDNYLNMFIGDSGGYTFGHASGSPTNLRDNNWHHVAVVFDRDASATRYVDGKVDGTPTSISTRTGSINNAANFNIGSGATSYFNGLIDDVRVYNYARTPAQIAYDYNRGAPVAWYKMDECEGTTIHDASGNNNTGTLTIGGSGTNTAAGTCQTSGTAWYNGASGKYSSAMSFDGTDDYITIPDSSAIDFNSKSFSWSFWTKRSSTGQKLILGQGTTGTDTSLVVGFRSTNKFTFAFWGDDLDTTDTFTNTTNWYHFVGTYDATTNSRKIYVNGVLNISDTANSDYQGTGNLGIGGGYGGWSTYYYPGLIDDVRIYNYALSATQIKKLYNENSSIRFGP